MDLNFLLKFSVVKLKSEFATYTIIFIDAYTRRKCQLAACKNMPLEINFQEAGRSSKPYHGCHLAF